MGTVAKRVIKYLLFYIVFGTLFFLWVIGLMKITADIHDHNLREGVKYELHQKNR